MKRIICLIGGIVCLVVGVGIAANGIAKSINGYDTKKVSWLNDNVYYTTNLVMDTEKNKTLPTNFTQLYVFPVVLTNRVNPTYFLINGKVSEIGGREDGVLVWRAVKK